MKKIKAVAVKELSSYFKSPMAYIILVVMITVFNVFFYLLIDGNREASLKDMFQVMEFMFVFFIPLLTMRAFSEEKQNGTMEFLMTTPATNTDIIGGKYVGTAVFLTIIISFTSVYYFIIEFFGVIDTRAALAGYLGIWLEGVMFAAVGIMCSSFTKNQIVAVISTYVILLSLYFCVGFQEGASGASKAVLSYVAVINHSQNFFSGLITIESLVYYLSIIFFSLTMTRLTIETRLWR